MRWGKGWRERERWTWFHIPHWGEAAREAFYWEGPWLIAPVPNPIWGLVWPPGQWWLLGTVKENVQLQPSVALLYCPRFLLLPTPSSIPSEPHLCWALKRQFSSLFPKPTDPMSWGNDHIELIIRGAVLGVVSSCNPSAWEAEVGGWRGDRQLGPHSETLFQKWGGGCHSRSVQLTLWVTEDDKRF